MTRASARAGDAPCPDGQVPAGSRRRGRPPATSRAELERLAIDLFLERGFEDTTIDDVAAQARIGRRTFFRYFASKNDVPWGDFDAQLVRMREVLAALPEHLPSWTPCAPPSSTSTAWTTPRPPGCGGGCSSSSPSRHCRPIQ